MSDDEKCVQVGSLVWKWHESVGWYDADEDDPTFGNEGVLLDEIMRLRAVLDAIDTLHQPDYEYPDECTECDFAWPCDTNLLLHPQEARRG